MMRKIVTCLLSIAMLILLSVTLSAQEGEPDVTATPVINARNFTQLQSVQQIDFADLVGYLGEFLTGRFALSGDGQMVALVNEDNEILVLDTQGDLLGTYHIPDTDVIDMTFNAIDGTFLSLHYADGTMTLVESSLSFDQPEQYDFSIDGFPQSIWTDEANTIWVEIVGEDIQVAQINLETDSLDMSPYAPALDQSAVVRIGRIPPPYVVTSSQDGVVKLWNLQTGDVIYEVAVENGPAVFGQINANASHLAWRDQASAHLYLLDFVSGENQVIADLNGEYVQYFFLSPDADVIIATHIEDRSDIVAWDVATGERYLLGEHRLCTRVPDMIRMSDDGTTLVIGCDTGLDVWRIVE